MGKGNTRNKHPPIPAAGKPNQSLAARFQAQSFQGPIPPPVIMEQYEDIYPGSVDRILAMAERQAAHRMDLERTVVRCDKRDSLLGLIFGFVLGLASIAGGVYCISNGNQISGSVVGGLGVTGLVSVFVYGREQRRKERESRLKLQLNSEEDTTEKV